MNEVTLREVIEADLPIFYEYQRDEEATRMAAFPSREHDAFMAHWHKILVDKSNITRTILYDGLVAGNIASFMMEGEREVGYWIGREYWGRGVGTRALAALLNLVQVRPLYAHVVHHNTGSRRVLEKNGFVLIREEGDEFVLKLE